MSRSLLELVESLSNRTLNLRASPSNWPTFGRVWLGDHFEDVALFASRVGRSGRSERDAVERRFQNPRQDAPTDMFENHLSLLLGVWIQDDLVSVENPVVVLADASRRVGKRTRWSVFVSLSALETAARTGWASYTSNSGERIFCFQPALISLAVTALYEGDTPSDYQIQDAVRAPDADLDGDLPLSGTEDRARRTVSALVRSSRFRGQVLGAYNHRCAMCDVGLSLVQAAHIYPAAAPGSRDAVSNGVALCANHHVAFDRHQIAIDPRSLRILHHPDVVEQARQDRAARNFLEGTFAQLTLPEQNAEPDPAMLINRIDFFEREYAWALGG